MNARKLHNILFGTLRSRLTISVAALFVAMMALLVFDLTVHQRAMLLENRTDAAIALSRSLATSAAGWIASDDIAGLQELAENQSHYPDMRFIVFTDETGRILAHTDKTKSGLYVLDFPKNAQQAVLNKSTALIDVVAPALLSNRHVGWVRVGIGQEKASQKLIRITLLGILYAIGATIIGSIIAWYMGWRITRRLYAVQDTISLVRGGDHVARANLSGSDEAASIAREFNTMLDALDERNRALRQANLYNRNLIETSVDPLVTIGLDGKITDVNTASENATGCSREQLIGTDFADYFTDPAKARAGYKKVFKDGAVHDYELELKNKNGTVIPVLYNASVYCDESGAAIGVFAAARDITERKRSEERLVRLNWLEASLLGPGSVLEKSKRITDGVVDILRADFARIWLIRPGDMCDTGCPHAKVIEGPHVCRFRDKCLHLVSSSGRYTHIDGEMHRRVPFGCYKIGKVASGEEAGFLINDVVNDPRVYNKEWARSLGLVSFGGYKLQSSDGKPIGVLALFSRHAISPEESALLEAIAGTTSQVLQTSIAEEALKQSEERFRMLYEEAPLPYQSLDEAGNFLYVNDTWLNMLGYKKEEVIGKNFAEFLAGDWEKAFRDRFPRFKNEGQVGPVQFELKKKDGSAIWIELNGRIGYDKSGNFARTHCIFHDISERRRAEEALLQSERKLKAVIYGSPIPQFVIGRDHAVIYWNRALEEITGIKAAEVIGTDRQWKAFYDKKRPCMADLLVDGATDKIPELYHGKYSKSMLAADAYEITDFLPRLGAGGKWLHFTTAAIKDSEGSIIGAVETLEDITERRRAEEKASRLVAIVESSDDAIIGKTLDGTITSWNKGAERMYGYTEAEAIGMMIYVLVPPGCKDEIRRILDRIERGEHIDHYETTRRRKEGTLIGVSLTVSPIFDATGLIVGASTIARDITERKKNEEELRIYREHLEDLVKERTVELERSNKELEQFAYIASHDLQEPLRMVVSYIQLIEKRFKDSFNAEAREFMWFAVDGAKRMQQLINDLLTYSRVTTRGKPLTQVSCEAVLENSLRNLAVALEECHGTVTHDALPDVFGDDTQLVQLFQNLIGNGLKFHGDKPPAVHVSCVREGNAWVFSVRDNGIGIDPQYYETIFLIFRRLHGRDEYPGTGIGLAVCKKVVERHGGRIWVESVLKEGSTFYFTLPVSADKTEVHHGHK